MEILNKLTHKLFLPLILVGLVFCSNESLNDEEIIQLFHSIQELEHKDSLNTSLINDYKNQLQWKEEMIDLVRPKWYDNKYLWFFGGMIITSGSVYLAGQIK